MNIRKTGLCFLTILPFLCHGCGPAMVGTAAVGTYKGATDTRTIGTMLDDSVITSQVKTRLLSDEFVNGLKIDVDTVQQVVTLTGVLETASERRIAVDIARATPGVLRVKNLLTVGSKSIGQTMDDTIIGNRIKSGLIAEPGIRSLNIDVDVNQGRVTLTGVVGTPSERDRVLAIAKACSGTVAVQDNLTITGQ
ncbi:MAG: BON domain-containing protein [Desulfobacteraceae bacterium]|nr:BON domain-containing protein [Desulfobacteraceae bacterium]